MSLYLHTPVLERGSWHRVDTASGTNTPTTVYNHDGTSDPIGTSLGASGSTVQATTRDGTAWFWSSAATLYVKELDFKGVPNGTVVTSTGVTPSAPVGGAPVDIATISTTVAALPSTYVRQRANTIALLGDSITSQNTEVATYNSNPWWYTRGSGFFTWANALLGQRLVQVTFSTSDNEFGGSGKTAAQLVSEGHVANVIAAKPAYCHVLCGRNDIFVDSTDAATTFARVQAVVTPLTQAGIIVVLGTILPGSSPSSAVVPATNTLLRRWAQTQPNVVLNDWYPVLLDTTSATAGLSSYFYDGTHPNGAGGTRLGKHLADVLDTIIPRSWPQIDNSGLLVNKGFQLGTGGGYGGSQAGQGSGSVATNGTCYINSASVTVVGSKVARTDNIPGSWQQFDVTGTASYEYTMNNANVGTDWAVGDVVYGIVEYQTDSSGWAGNQLFAVLRALPQDIRVDAGGNTSDNTMHQPALASGVLRTPNFVIPTSTTSLRLGVTCGGGAHTLRVGRMQIYKAPAGSVSGSLNY